MENQDTQWQMKIPNGESSNDLKLSRYENVQPDESHEYENEYENEYGQQLSQDYQAKQNFNITQYQWIDRHNDGDWVRDLNKQNKNWKNWIKSSKSDGGLGFPKDVFPREDQKYFKAYKQYYEHGKIEELEYRDDENLVGFTLDLIENGTSVKNETISIGVIIHNSCYCKRACAEQSKSCKIAGSLRCDACSGCAHGHGDIPSIIKYFELMNCRRFKVYFNLYGEEIQNVFLDKELKKYSEVCVYFGGHGLEAGYAGVDGEVFNDEYVSTYIHYNPDTTGNSTYNNTLRRKGCKVKVVNKFSQCCRLENSYYEEKERKKIHEIFSILPPHPHYVNLIQNVLSIQKNGSGVIENKRSKPSDVTGNTRSEPTKTRNMNAAQKGETTATSGGHVEKAQGMLRVCFDRYMEKLKHDPNLANTMSGLKAEYEKYRLSRPSSNTSPTLGLNVEQRYTVPNESKHPINSTVQIIGYQTITDNQMMENMNPHQPEMGQVCKTEKSWIVNIGVPSTIQYSQVRKHDGTQEPGSTEEYEQTIDLTSVIKGKVLACLADEVFSKTLSDSFGGAR